MSNGSDSFYKIGEVAKIVGIKTYVLRFWEKEFPQLKPKRTRSGQRVYTSKDIELIKKIIYLLYHEGMSIKGARKRLEMESKVKDTTYILDEIRKDLLDIKKILKGDLL